MSILYDYLKVLERKGMREGESPEAPIWRKKSLNAWFYLATGFLFIFSVLVILFFRNTNNLIVQPTQGKSVNNQQVFNPVSRDNEGINSNNAYGLDFSLKGIIYNAESPSAIINGNLVEKNAKIGDWLVTDISSSEVKLENSKNSSLLTLKLNLPQEK